MGLFGSAKKEPIKSKLEIPSFSGMSSSSQGVPSNIPDDIPMQLPKFPEPAQEFSSSQQPFPSQNNFQNQNFQNLSNMSSNQQYNMNTNQGYSNSSSVSKEDAINDLEKAIPSFGKIQDISSQMKSDPSNPFEREQTSKSVESSVLFSKDSRIPVPSIVVGERDHNEVRNELVIDSPIYVNVVDFSKILQHLAEIKNGMTETNNGYVRITNILKDKDIQFNSYDRLLEEIQKKLIYIDKGLFEE